MNCQDIWHRCFSSPPALHTPKVSLCPADVASRLGSRACECTGIQRGDKFRPLTWLRTQASQLARPPEYQRTPSVTQLPTPCPFRSLALALNTAVSRMNPRNSNSGYSVWHILLEQDGHFAGFRTLRMIMETFPCQTSSASQYNYFRLDSMWSFIVFMITK